ncbi:MAG: hypothetical protein ACRCUT_11785, partial [Spirochaetota bacterium]
MKVIHVLKKIEQIDEDVKELRKMEKALQRNKSFTTPIYMTIEKQINNLLGDKVKMLELVISNPPEALAREFDGEQPKEFAKLLKRSSKNDKSEKPVKKEIAKKKKEEPVKAGSGKKKQESAVTFPVSDDPYYGDDDIPMLTQDMIDSRFDTMKKDVSAKAKESAPLSREDDRDV